MTDATNKCLRVVIWCAVSDPKQAAEEKISLAEQEELLRAEAQKQGWLVVDVLIVPGFSRRFYNFPEFAAAAAKESISAPNRLLKHWQDKDFDILACRYGSRFAREQSIFGEVVARTIDINARIFTLTDGWVNKSNYRMYISMGGYAASTEVDRLVTGFKEEMTNRAKQGLPVTHRILISHQAIVNDKGKTTKLVVNDDRRRLFEDFANVLLTGVSWSEIPLILFEEYGHSTPSGKPWSSSVLWRTVHSPWFWGHGARLYTKDKKQTYGIWAFDLSLPPPEGAMIYPNTHAPAYIGFIAEKVKSELRRRHQVNVGRAGHSTASPFTGLLICGSCGYRMRYKRPSNNLWEGYSCVSRDPRYRLDPHRNCDSYPRTIKLSTIRQWIDIRLRQMIETGNVTGLLPTYEKSSFDRIESLKNEITQTERRVEGFLLQRADTPGNVQSILSDLITQASNQLEILRSNLDIEVGQQLTTQDALTAAESTLEEIIMLSLDKFWQQPSSVINRQLFTLLGKNRLVIKDGNIIGFNVAAR